MTYAFQGATAPDYDLCRYGASRLSVRGPQQDLTQPFVAVLGGSETFGPGIQDPYPNLLQRLLGQSVINLGCQNAGPDAFNQDQTVIDIARQARCTVVQVVGAQNLTNRYYFVHPRRNDRFLRASPLLIALFPEVDFTDFHFTLHMLRSLQSLSPARFKVLTDELRAAWVVRMARLLIQIGGKTLILWLSDQAPPNTAHADLSRNPVLVDADMMATVARYATARLDVILPPMPRRAAIMPFEMTAMGGFLDSASHAQVAVRVATALTALTSQAKSGANTAPVKPDYSFSISSGTAVNRSATRP